MRNYGQENATLCGIQMARYDVIVTMDDDLQHSPEDLPKLISKLDEGYDVVYGVPRVRQQAWWRSMFSSVVKRAVSFLIGLPAIRDMSSYKAFRTSLKPAFSKLTSPDVQIDVLLSWATTRFTSVQVEEATHAAGKTNYSINKLIKVSLLILTNYTTIPLRFASILGFLFTIFGFFVLVYVLEVFFTVGSIPGFSFLASAITIFSGVQLFALGIIGEYLARMFERTSGKQPYIVIKHNGEQRMNVVILQPSYIPWRGYFDQIRRADVFIFYDDVQYDKHGWRNRNQIKSLQGKQWLTIPVHSAGATKGLSIKEVNIDWSKPWPKNHIKALTISYNKAPYFKRYLPLLETFYSRHDKSIADFTIATTIAACERIEHTPHALHTFL